jgi:arylsulfatase A-like enzyme
MTSKKQEIRNISFLRVCSLVFVLFFTYLLGDVFYRWDGFRYYAKFSEFVSSVNLITILWAVVTVSAALVVWLILRAYEYIRRRTGCKISGELLLMFIGIEGVLGVLVLLIYRKNIWDLIHEHGKLVYSSLVLTAALATYLLRNKSESWLNIFYERIRPLVWLYGIWVVISFPLLGYHIWFEHHDTSGPQKIAQSLVPADKKNSNIILFTFDALTVKDMSLYGYHIPTMPFVEEWAKKASVFTDLIASSNFTPPTTATLMTGKRVWSHQTYGMGAYKLERRKRENLPRLLKNNGYYTMAFIQNPYISVQTLGIADSIDFAQPASEFRTPASLYGRMDDILYRLFGETVRLYDWIIQGDFVFGRLVSKFFREHTENEYPPEKVFEKFFEAVPNIPSRPFFAWIHIFPPHEPYLPPDPYMGMFDASGEMRTFQQQAHGGIKWDASNADKLRARYDEFIRYCDDQFKDFMVLLSEKKLLNNTVIILSADHGESFAHSYLGHGGKHLYEQVTRIPLIIKEPGQTAGQIIDARVRQVDIPATILDLADIDIPSWMEGRSLEPLIHGKTLPVLPATSVSFERNPAWGQKITKGTIAIWEGEYKLIHYLEDNKSLLFNLRQDPEELNDLFTKESVVGQRLLTIVKNRLQKVNEAMHEEEYYQ